ncbi:MAG TPA: type IV secretory system conjugative DNA transfer family protein [Acidimicrobiales bacterium]|nr:type IV secretory system conjugative DNA transfer family protein [Acidimicrobiales bacterium]
MGPGRNRPFRPYGPPPGAGGAGLVVVAVVAVAALSAWAGACLSSAVGGCALPSATRAVAGLLAGVVRPVGGAGSARCGRGPAFWVGFTVSAVLTGLVGVWLADRWRRWFGPGARTRRTAARPGRRRLRWTWRPQAGARWAGRADQAVLRVRGPQPGRLVLGRSGRQLVAGEARQSVLVVGPTQTMKTSGLAVPALLEWQGPVMATSVKSDLLVHTARWRAGLGRLQVFDPSGCTGMATHSWSPLTACTTWRSARRTASAMVAASRSEAAATAEAEFWQAVATRLIAPLLFAAACGGRSMKDVCRWVDSQEVDEVAALLDEVGVEEACLAAEASWRREDRQRSSAYTTAETILEPFAELPTADDLPLLDTEDLLDGGSHALYLCSPAHEQRRLRPLFAAVVDQVVSAAYERSASVGGPVDPALLVVLDEAAAIAPVDDLAELAATGAGQGIQLVTVWQDIAQIRARYGPRAASVVNNHRAKLLLSGVSDPDSLEHVSALVGEEERVVPSVTHDAYGGVSTTEAANPRRLAPADALRRVPPGRAVLVYGHLPPIQLELRPWFADPGLRRRVEG